MKSVMAGLASIRLSVCPVGILTGTHQVCDAASVHFDPTISRTSILVNNFIFVREVSDHTFVVVNLQASSNTIL